MNSTFGRICLAAMLAVASTAWAAIPKFDPPQPEEATLDNGLRVVVFHDDRWPTARVQLLVPAGIAAQRPDENGVAHFTGQMLRRGTATRNATEFAAALEGLGTNLTVTARRDFTLLDMGLLADDLKPGLALLAEAVRSPAFALEEIGRQQFEVSRALIELHLNLVSTGEEQIWPLAMSGHPYGQTPAGDVPSTVQIDREKLVAFHGRYYKPQGSVLVVAGDVSLAEVTTAAGEAFTGWVGTAESVPIVPVRTSTAGPRIRIVDLPSGARTEIRVALPAPERGSADNVAVDLMNRLLGVGADSRLGSTRLEGVYGSAHSSYTALRDAGLIITSAAVRTDQAGSAVAAVQQTIEGLRKSPPAGDAVDAAKQLMMTTWPLTMETPGGMITQWNTADRYGLGEAFLDGYAEALADVDPGDLARVAAEWLRWERASVLAVGPADVLREQLEPLGEVEVIRLRDAPQAAWASTVPTEEDFRKGREVAQQAIEAHGGLPALAAVKGSSIEAALTVDVDGRASEGRLRQARQDPWKFREVLELFIYASEYVLNGDRGWANESQSNAVVVADSLEIATMRANFESDVVHLVRLLADENTQVAHRGIEIVAGAQADLLQVLSGGRTRWLLFDNETHRLVGLDVRGGVPPRILARRTFGDYREVEGVMWPFLEERFEGNAKIMRIDVEQVLVNPEFSERLFDAPEPRR